LQVHARAAPEADRQPKPATFTDMLSRPKVDTTAKASKSAKSKKERLHLFALPHYYMEPTPVLLRRSAMTDAKVSRLQWVLHKGFGHQAARAISVPQASAGSKDVSDSVHAMPLG
jgi:hypothetical protein